MTKTVKRLMMTIDRNSSVITPTSSNFPPCVWILYYLCRVCYQYQLQKLIQFNDFSPLNRKINQIVISFIINAIIIGDEKVLLIMLWKSVKLYGAVNCINEYFLPQNNRVSKNQPSLSPMFTNMLSLWKSWRRKCRR